MELEKSKKAGSALVIRRLVGVAIVVLIPVLAISSVLRSYQAEQESSALLRIHAINAAEKAYRTKNGGRVGSLLQLITAGALDPHFAFDSGYNFAVVTSSSGYTATATPRSTGNGRYGYYSEPDGVIRYQSSVTADCKPCFPAGKAGSPLD
jgi:type II secretory pathway pseudopilin PulG